MAATAEVGGVTDAHDSRNNANRKALSEKLRQKERKKTERRKGMQSKGRLHVNPLNPFWGGNSYGYLGDDEEAHACRLVCSVLGQFVIQRALFCPW